MLNDLELNLGLCGERLVTVSAMAYPLSGLSGYENIFGYKTRFVLNVKYCWEYSVL